MTDFSLLSQQLATEQVADRVRRAERARRPGSHRPRGRHAFAQRLHHLADRLDT